MKTLEFSPKFSHSFLDSYNQNGGVIKSLGGTLVVTDCRLCSCDQTVQARLALSGQQPLQSLRSELLPCPTLCFYQTIRVKKDGIAWTECSALLDVAAAREQSQWTPGGLETLEVAI